MISGMGRAIGTAILLVAYPDRYGVWNNTSEAGIKRVNLWPEFARGESEGSRYAKINELLCAIAKAAEVDLWTLDTLWYYLIYDEDEPRDAEAVLTPEFVAEVEVQEITPGEQVFGLERHLQDFLWLNWDETELGNEWRRYQEPGNETAGYEYSCSVGRIDILAQHRQNGDWLIVELKRAQGSDVTLGQLLRYMGWVKRHLATPAETVHGLIVAHQVTDQLRYAAQAVPNVGCKEYQVKFTLRDALSLD
ncbi:MAG: DUF91 domain-containing protein [Anaerolineales bacterium]|nr:DUF91 domain-containing protein [Anaerolineales bacterium]